MVGNEEKEKQSKVSGGVCSQEGLYSFKALFFIIILLVKRTEGNFSL